jgi:ubiquinone biosynthesis protein UbiJ
MVAFCFSRGMKLESPFAAALNRLLDAEPWARERLAPFAGESLALRAPPLPALRFAVAADGRLAADAGVGAPALTVTVGPGALAAAMKGEEHLLRAIDVAGNARLASEVMFLARHLRWDFEEDAAKLVGDVAAHRLAAAVRGVAAWHADAARRIAESLVEYAAEEARVIVPRAELAEIAAANARLRDGLERLDKRLDRLRGPRPAGR